MRKLMFISACVITMAGCATGGGAGHDATGARLPTGVTLLESAKDRCAGVVHVSGRSVASNSNGITVGPGQNASFAVESDRVNWTCVTDASTVTDDRVVCPTKTSYVRITRASQSNEFLVECYGRKS